MTEPIEKAPEEAAEVTKEAHTVVTEPPETQPRKTVEDIPDWGKSLIERVEDIASVVSKPADEGAETVVTPGHGDTVDPKVEPKKPWHKR